MRQSILNLCLVVLLLVAFTSSSALGGPGEPTTGFSIHLENVPDGRADDDLLSLFIRERNDQIQIIVTLTNRKVSRGRAKATFYYLENLRVRPGQIVRIVPEGRAREFEAQIQTIEARFPPGKPPQLQIIASSAVPEPLAQSRPYPRLATEGFVGQRTLDTTKTKNGKPRPDVINCLGDTPGDLRIRQGTYVDVENVGLAFSTVYLIDDAQHSWTANNGLQTRYRGTRYVTGRKATR